jgi:tetratricopeptide (TPR) repeat protein
VDRGRFADAERLLDEASGDALGELRRYLVPLFWHEGRTGDARRLIEEDWEDLDRSGLGGSDRAIEAARLHVVLGAGDLPTEAVRAFLERAARLAPDDDRVWLGRANLAIRLGAADEAARWLEACLRRCPRDVPVWRARLDWALATGRVPEVEEAVAHLPAEAMGPAQAHRIAAWLAARRGDDASERRALEALVAVDPADEAALDRLAELATREGRPDRAEDFRRRKAEIGRALARFQALFRRNQPVRDAEELARLAERLGRPFEARAFLRVALASDPDRADIRDSLAALRPRESPDARPGRTLAEVLAPALAAGDGKTIGHGGRRD